MSDRADVVVLGVGNTLMSDEGAGVRAALVLERSGRLPPEVRVIDGGTSTHELLEDLEHLDLLVIVDAVASDRAPGTVICMEGDRVPSAFSNRLSPHQHGINDLLAKLQLLGRHPSKVALFGVVPERVELGLELSSAVEEGVHEVCDRVVDFVRAFLP